MTLHQTVCYAGLEGRLIGKQNGKDTNKMALSYLLYRHHLCLRITKSCKVKEKKEQGLWTEINIRSTRIKVTAMLIPVDENCFQNYF